MAQMSRLVHSDSGFAWYTMQKCLGLSNDLVNKVLREYDTKRLADRKVSAPIGDGTGRPMKSFATRVNPPSTENAWGTYISTSRDMTAAVFDISKMPLKPNPSSIFRRGDILIAFKSTSTLINLYDDLKAQFKSIDLQDALEGTGIRMKSENNMVPESFIRLLLGGLHALIKSLDFHVKNTSNRRLFITGHSLGGALATLLGFIFAEAKVTGTLSIVKYFKSIHVISFGAPTVCDDVARNSFNKHLTSGLLTYDRVIAQTYPSLIVNIHSIFIKNDYIPGIPVGYSHPGYKPLITESADPMRPYSIDTVRKLYGVNTITRFRDTATWPFREDMQLFSDTDKLEDAAKSYMVGGTAAKDEYAEETKHRVPNMISVPPLPSIIFVHGETLGMIAQSGHRTFGVKNPVRPESDLIAYFSFCPTGVKVEYLKPDGSLISLKNGGNATRKRS